MATYEIIPSKATKGETVASTQETKQPLAPTVFKAIKSGKKLTVDITVLIDANFNGVPQLAVDGEGTSFFVQYNYKEEIPEKLTHWMVTATLKSNCKVGDKVTAYNQDIDPVTSRGTVTGVIRS